MNKFQKANFRSVYDFMDYLPDDESKVVEKLREVILDTIPNVKESLKFNVPSYPCHLNICFLWPSSIPWGAVEKGVSLGFVEGNRIIAGFGYLDDKGRKTIRSKEYSSLKEIDFDLVRTMLYEAVEIDMSR
ncbi:MAG: DUF1801 domain-containing protein [Bacteroidota bacterium]